MSSAFPVPRKFLFMEALEREPAIKYILGLNEIVSAAMAEGYARASGRPGFLNLHTGPGLAASLPMLYNAHAGGVPLVITVGQQHTRLLQYDPHLSGDILGMGKLYTKWCTEITHAEDLQVTIQRAFKMAMQPPTGPALISIPQNVLAQEIEFQYRPNTFVFPRLRPDRDAVDGALDILLKAQKPLILVESGVSRSDALEQAVRFAELIGARVYQQWMSDVNFPVDHPQYLGDLDPTSPPAKKLLGEADVLIGIGCPMFAMAFYNPEFAIPEGVRFVHIDENPWEIGKNFPVDCGIQADIKTTLEELNRALERQMPPEGKSDKKRPWRKSLIDRRRS
ncbi:MAG: thiamine pyrophosphate-binding protein [Deltaproteobacteria bacterium]|nr:thiamine pyrophosphate-binding protein [Deltaproteobacteria bacterium]